MSLKDRESSDKNSIQMIQKLDSSVVVRFYEGEPPILIEESQSQAVQTPKSPFEEKHQKIHF